MPASSRSRSAASGAGETATSAPETEVVADALAEAVVLRGAFFFAALAGFFPVGVFPAGFFPVVFLGSGPLDEGRGSRVGPPGHSGSGRGRHAGSGTDRRRTAARGTSSHSGRCRASYRTS